MVRTMVLRMTDAASPFLNLPLRTEHAAEAARERQRRLQHHGAAFCRHILDGAYERVDQPDGGYRLRDVATGHWMDEGTSPGDAMSHLDAARTATATPGTVPETTIACRLGYQTALRDITRWISRAAVEPRMHAETLAALNAQISLLADRPAKMIEHAAELG